MKPHLWTRLSSQLSSAEGFELLMAEPPPPPPSSSWVTRGREERHEEPMLSVGCAPSTALDAIPCWLEGCGKEIFNSKPNMNRMVISCNIYAIRKVPARAV